MLKPFFEHKKSLLFTALVLVLVLLLPENALAQNTALNSPLQSVLYTIVTSVFGKFVWVGGAMLDYSIAIFVVGFGQQYATTGLGFAIDSLWSVVRDIFNLTFIFGLVYIGFKMIFDSSDSNARKMLGSLVMAALLVNFSLFITKFVIDFSNIAASQFAAAFYSSGTGTYEVAASFMNLLGLSTLWQTGSMVSNGAGYGYIFGTLILFLVAAFVFGAGAILLTIRFVVLNIYMVLSPLMFLGWVFPGFSGTSKEYWKGFLSRAFFAPAYILMIYFSNQILVNLRGSGAGGNMANVFGADTVSQTTFSSVMPYFILTCVFLISSLVVANKMGAQGATSALAMGKRASSKARSMATAMPRKGARIVTNAAGEYVGKKLNNLQGGNGWVAKFAKTNMVDQTVRGAATTAAKAKFGTSGSNKEQRAYRSKTESRAATTAAIRNGQSTAAELAAIRGFSGPLSPAQLAAQQARLAVLEAQESAMKSAVAGMGTSDIEEMGDAERLAVAEMFSSTQIENINKSDNISGAEKGKIDVARQAAITKVIGSTGAFVTSELNKLSIHQIETLGETWIAQNAHVLSDSQMEEVKKSKRYTENQKSTFATKRSNEFVAAGALTLTAAGAANRFEQIFKDKKPKDIAKLPADLIKNPSSWKYLSAAALKEIATNGPLSPADQRALQTALLGAPAGLTHTSAAGYFGSAHAIANWG